LCLVPWRVFAGNRNRRKKRKADCRAFPSEPLFSALVLTMGSFLTCRACKLGKTPETGFRARPFFERAGHLVFGNRVGLHPAPEKNGPAGKSWGSAHLSFSSYAAGGGAAAPEGWPPGGGCCAAIGLTLARTVLVKDRRLLRGPGAICHLFPGEILTFFGAWGLMLPLDL